MLLKWASSSLVFWMWNQPARSSGQADFVNGVFDWLGYISIDNG
jgi:hypothetical protein